MAKFLIDHIRDKRNKIDILNVASLLRTQGIYSFDEIHYAQIEPNGQITVICIKDKIFSNILIKEGLVIAHGLNEINKGENWLKKQMQAAKIKEYEDIFLAEYWNGVLKFFLNDGNVKKVKV